MKLLSFILILVSIPAYAGNIYDGQWLFDVKSSFPSVDCEAFLIDNAISVRNGKFAGYVSGFSAGSLTVSGTVNKDGTLKDFVIYSFAVDARFSGSLASKTGTWHEERMDCDGTWKAFRK